MRARGSFTVELAFLMPIIFSVIIGMLFTGFFLHDRVALHAAAFELITDETIAIDERQFILLKQIDQQVNVKNDSITVQLKGKTKIPILLFVGLDKKEFRVDVRMKRERTDPVSYVREKKKIKQLTGIEE